MPPRSKKNARYIHTYVMARILPFNFRVSYFSPLRNRTNDGQIHITTKIKVQLYNITPLLYLVDTNSTLGNDTHHGSYQVGNNEDNTGAKSNVQQL